MKQISTFVALALFSLGFVLFFSQPVMAYVGPGAGLAALGAFFALVVGVIAALFGFLWYPIKRLLKKRQQREDEQEEK